MKTNTAVKTLMLIVALSPMLWVLLIYPAINLTTLQTGIHLFILFISLSAILILYFIHIWRNNQLRKPSKINWAVLMFLFSGVAPVIYWFKHVKDS